MSPAALNLLHALEIAAPFLVIGVLVGFFWPEKRRNRVGDVYRYVMPTTKELGAKLTSKSLQKTSPFPAAVEKMTVTGPLEEAGASSSPTQRRVALA